MGQWLTKHSNCESPPHDMPTGQGMWKTTGPHQTLWRIAENRMVLMAGLWGSGSFKSQHTCLWSQKENQVCQIALCPQKPQSHQLRCQNTQEHPKGKLTTLVLVVLTLQPNTSTRSCAPNLSWHYWPKLFQSLGFEWNVLTTCQEGSFHFP